MGGGEGRRWDETCRKMQFGRLVLLNGPGGGAGGAPAVFQRFGAVPHVDGGGRRLRQQERSSTTQSSHSSTHLMKARFRFRLAAHVEETPVAGVFHRRFVVDHHPSFIWQNKSPINQFLFLFQIWKKTQIKSCKNPGGSLRISRKQFKNMDEPWKRDMKAGGSWPWRMRIWGPRSSSSSRVLRAEAPWSAGGAWAPIQRK